MHIERGSSGQARIGCHDRTIRTFPVQLLAYQGICGGDSDVLARVQRSNNRHQKQYQSRVGKSRETKHLDIIGP